MSDPEAPCPSCGTPAPAGASFCGNCGASLTGAAPAAPAHDPPSRSDSQNWAMAAHLTALAGAFVGGVASFVGPLVIWLVRKDQQDDFAVQHALEALNFNLMVLGLVILGIIASVLTLGLGLLVVGPAGLVMAVLWLIWTIQAALAASRGQAYRYPVSIRLIS